MQITGRLASGSRPQEACVWNRGLPRAVAGLQARVCGRAGGRGPGCMLQPGRGEVVRDVFIGVEGKEGEKV